MKESRRTKEEGGKKKEGRKEGGEERRTEGYINEETKEGRKERK